MSKFHENELAQARRHLLRRHHLDGDEKHLLRREQCVIEALESVTHTKAPDAVRIKRIRDQVTKDNLEFDEALRHATVKGGHFHIVLDYKIAPQYDVEVTAVKNLIRDARRTDTAMGHALKSRPFRVAQLSELQVRERVQSGDDVIVVGRFWALRGGHTAHVGVLGPLLFDKVGWVPLKFKKGDPVTSFIFRKR